MAQYSEDFKKRVVRGIKKVQDDGKFESWSQMAEKYEVTATTLSSWFNDPRYNEGMVAGLPVEKNSSGRKPKAKKLVASAFTCPHCGGPITLED
jgi:transposase-like protein